MRKENSQIQHCSHCRRLQNATPPSCMGLGPKMHKFLLTQCLNPKPFKHENPQLQNSGTLMHEKSPNFLNPLRVQRVCTNFGLSGRISKIKRVNTTTCWSGVLDTCVLRALRAEVLLRGSLIFWQRNWVCICNYYAWCMFSVCDGVCMNVCMFVLCVYACTRAWVCACVCVCMCMYMLCICVCVYMYISLSLYIYIMYVLYIYIHLFFVNMCIPELKNLSSLWISIITQIRNKHQSLIPKI